MAFRKSVFSGSSGHGNLERYTGEGKEDKTSSQETSLGTRCDCGSVASPLRALGFQSAECSLRSRATQIFRGCFPGLSSLRLVQGSAHTNLTCPGSSKTQLSWGWGHAGWLPTSLHMVSLCPQQGSWTYERAGFQEAVSHPSKAEVADLLRPSLESSASFYCS